jgi:Flp pilus assembly protein TadG
MKTRQWSIHRDERGATLAFVVVIIFVLIGVVALAVDFGAVFVDRRRMVNASDAAALSAALEYAKKGATCGTNDLPAQNQATSLATSNVSGAVPDNRPGQNPYVVDCAKKTVTVQYLLTHDYLFAPAIGIESTPVVTSATGHWGPAGGAGGVLPLMVNKGRLSTCSIPGTVIGTECWFYDDNNALGNATWALMNVQPVCGDGKFGWNVSVSTCPSKVGNPNPTYNCPTFSNAELQNIVTNGSPALTFSFPQPTYVCAVPGNHASVFNNMDSLSGSVRLFPVNDESKQIKSGGALCPPPSCTPDMFDIVGFIQMKILNVWKGSDSGWDVANCPGVKKGSAYCMHTVWVGYTTDPGVICDACIDFGIEAIGLRG